MSDITRGLLIKSPYIDMILQGVKTWEIRGIRTAKRERIALMKSGANLILGTCDLVDVIGPINIDEYILNQYHHMDYLTTRKLPYKKTYAWVFQNPLIFINPIEYKNPPGAIIWVILPKYITEQIEKNK